MGMDRSKVDALLRWVQLLLDDKKIDNMRLLSDANIIFDVLKLVDKEVWMEDFTDDACGRLECIFSYLEGMHEDLHNAISKAAIVAKDEFETIKLLVIILVAAVNSENVPSFVEPIMKLSKTDQMNIMSIVSPINDKVPEKDLGSLLKEVLCNAVNEDEAQFVKSPSSFIFSPGISTQSPSSSFIGSPAFSHFRNYSNSSSIGVDSAFKFMASPGTSSKRDLFEKNKMNMRIRRLESNLTTQNHIRDELEHKLDVSRKKIEMLESENAKMKNQIKGLSMAQEELESMKMVKIQLYTKEIELKRINKRCIEALKENSVLRTEMSMTMERSEAEKDESTMKFKILKEKCDQLQCSENSLKIENAELVKSIKSQRDEYHKSIEDKVQECKELLDHVTYLKEKLSAHERLKNNVEDFMTSGEDNQSLKNEIRIVVLENELKKVTDELQSVQARASVEKHKKILEEENAKLTQELRRVTSSISDVEKKAKNLEQLLEESNMARVSNEESIQRFEAQAAKACREIDNLNVQLEEVELSLTTTERARSSLDIQLNEVQDQLEEETRQKLGLNTKLQEAEEEINRLQEQLEEEEDEKKAAQKQVELLQSQLEQLKKSVDEKQIVLKDAEAAEKKLQREVEVLLQREEDFVAENSRLERNQKLQEEARVSVEKNKNILEDENAKLTQELQSVTSGKSDVERIAKNLEQQLNEAIMARVFNEESIQRLEAQTAKACQEIDNLNFQLEEVELSLSTTERAKSSLDIQLNEVQDQLEEETRQKLGLNTKLQEAEEEINRLQEQLEEEEDEKKAAQKQVELLQSQLDQLKKSVDETQIVLEDAETSKKKLQREVEGLIQREEDLVAENSRLEKSQKLQEEELDNLRNELMDATAVTKNLQAKREGELSELKRNIEEETKQHEMAMQQLCSKHSNVVEGLNSQLDNTTKARASVEKHKKILEEENAKLTQELQRVTSSISDVEKKAKNLEQLLEESNMARVSNEESIQRLEAQAAKACQEIDNLNFQLEEVELSLSTTESAKSSLDIQLNEVQDQLEEETRQKLGLNTKLQETEEEINRLQEQLEEEEDEKKAAQKQVELLKSQLDQLKKSVDETQIVLEDAETSKKKLQREVEGLIQREEDLVAENSRLEKSQRLQEEELDNLRNELMDAIAVTKDLQAKREGELSELKRNIEEETKQHEMAMQQLCSKHSNVVEGLNSQLDNTTKARASVEKHKKILEEENAKLTQELQRVTSSISDVEKKAKNLEQLLEESNMARVSNEESIQRLEAQAAKACREIDNLNFQLEEVELSLSTTERAKSSLDIQLNEVQDQLEEETRQKLGLNTKLQETEEEINRLQEQLEEEEDEKKAAQKQVELLKSQLDQLKKSLDEKQIVLKDAEAAEKKLQREVEVLLQREEDLVAENSRLERNQKLQEEKEVERRITSLEAQVKCAASMKLHDDKSSQADSMQEVVELKPSANKQHNSGVDKERHFAKLRQTLLSSDLTNREEAPDISFEEQSTLVCDDLTIKRSPSVKSLNVIGENAFGGSIASLQSVMSIDSNVSCARGTRRQSGLIGGPSRRRSLLYMAGKTPPERRTTLSSVGIPCIPACQMEDEPDILESKGLDEDFYRIKELKRRNTLCLPHLKSSYPLEVIPTESSKNVKDSEYEESVRYSFDQGRKRKSEENGNFLPTKRTSTNASNLGWKKEGTTRAVKSDSSIVTRSTIKEESQMIWGSEIKEGNEFEAKADPRRESIAFSIGFDEPKKKLKPQGSLRRSRGSAHLVTVVSKESISVLKENLPNKMAVSSKESKIRSSHVQSKGKAIDGKIHRSETPLKQSENKTSLKSRTTNFRKSLRKSISKVRGTKPSM